MDAQTPFKWRHFLPDVILLNVRWYSRYSLSYRQLGHGGLPLTTDQSEGSFGKAQVLLEVDDKLGVVHERDGMTLLLRMPNTLAR